MKKDYHYNNPKTKKGRVKVQTNLKKMVTAPRLGGKREVTFASFGS